jgi:hypothetical protein
MILSGVGSAGILPAIVCPKHSPARPFGFAQGRRQRYLNLRPSRPCYSMSSLSPREMRTKRAVFTAEEFACFERRFALRIEVRGSRAVLFHIKSEVTPP